MPKEYPPEDEEEEKPHCKGCENYVFKVRKTTRPEERCTVSPVEINSGYIAKRSRGRCPKGKGKYGKGNNNYSQLRGAQAGLSGEDRPPRRAGTPYPEFPRGGANGPRVVPQEWSLSSLLQREDSLRERRCEELAAISGTEARFAMRGEPIPEGYRICVPRIAEPSVVSDCSTGVFGIASIDTYVFTNGRWEIRRGN